MTGKLAKLIELLGASKSLATALMASTRPTCCKIPAACGLLTLYLCRSASSARSSCSRLKVWLAMPAFFAMSTTSNAGQGKSMDKEEEQKGHTNVSILQA